MEEVSTRLVEHNPRRHRLESVRKLIALGLFGAAFSGSPAEPADQGSPVGPFFTDRAAEWGLEFAHFNGMSGEFYFPEMTGQGAALFDYDGDGDLDAYLVQGSVLGPGVTLADAIYPFQGPVPPADRLFRNDLATGDDGGPTPHFVDVTTTSRIAATGYGMGVTIGDYDNDGLADIYVTNYGPNQLWRNHGDGTFSDVTATAGVGDALWGTSSAFADLDGDGWLDLYVVNYVEFDLTRNPRCFATSSRRDYCGPSAFPPQPDRLYRNRRDGTFEDVTHRLLRDYTPGPGLGVKTADFNGDGRLDLYVANDGAVNQMWLAQPDGTFIDEALFSGTAINRMGRPEASMGVDAADFDLDGDIDLFMTHLAGETNTLYVNDGHGMFEDRTVASGLGSVSLPYTTFGTGWIDYDNDGLLDLLALNGAVRILEDQAASGDAFPLKQPNQLFRNLGGRFVDVSAEAGSTFATFEVSRGAAFGDIDNDGDEDVLAANNNGPARLLVNQVGQAHGWLGLVLTRDVGGAAAGARAVVHRSDGRKIWRQVGTDGSYCSARDPRLLVGLETEDPEQVGIVKAGPRRETHLLPPTRRYLLFFGTAGRPTAGE